MSANTAPSWVRYMNHGTRNLPLSEQLLKALSFVPEMGLAIDVFSGGQPGIGSGGARVGSTRHDHGNAADVFFRQGDRRLDWANAGDLPIYQDFVRRAKQAGLTGFGAGPGYMQPGSMHIGFGSPGVWGAGGKGANAPGWLREAYGARIDQRTPAAPVGPQPVRPAAPTPSPAPMTASAPQNPGFGEVFQAAAPRAIAAMGSAMRPQAPIEVNFGDPGAAMVPEIAAQGAQRARGLLDMLTPDVERLLGLSKPAFA